MDMTLKKKYNNLAKGPSGNKEAVCKWNLIRHDKLLYTSNLEFLWDRIVGDEFNLDHKFSAPANKTDKIAVDTLFEYFKDNSNPFDFSNDKVTNFVAAEFIDPELTENLIHILQWVKGCTVSLNHHNLIKRLLSCLPQSQNMYQLICTNC